LWRLAGLSGHTGVDSALSIVSGGGASVGTMTFLFTDIEGSTRRREADAEAMRIALAVHDEVLRAVVGRTGLGVQAHR
jgi:hypothetical protein